MLATGVLKQQPEDFVVDELLAFELTGNGEHIYLHIRKRLNNTQWVVKQLAQHFHCQARDIGYAGLKDRHAVTTQWFSLPARSFTEAKADSFACQGIDIIEVGRSSGKLRRGAIRQNCFDIRIREVTLEPDKLTQRVDHIAAQGVPNYFGEQRFGIQRQNLHVVDTWFAGKTKVDRFKRSLYLSAARSWLFNLVLAERIRQDNWCQALHGDVYMLEGSKRFFCEPIVDDEIRRRMADGDIHPSGPLWGEGEPATIATALLLEQNVLADLEHWRQGLARAGLKQQRRALRVIPHELTCDYDEVNKELRLWFSLPAGCYATGLVREIVATTDESGGELELADE